MENVAYPGEFIAWVTCMLPSYEDYIIAGMVKKGYMVSAAASDGQIVWHQSGTPATVICLRIASSNKELAPNDIKNHLSEVLEEKNFLYYSIVVTSYTSCAWNSTNISLARVEPPQPSLPEPSKSNLN